MSDETKQDGRRVVTEAAWRAEGAALFGADTSAWRFVCPSCGFVASVKDWRDAGARDGEIAFSCIGRHKGADGTRTFKREGGPCDYAGGGLFLLNPVRVTHDGGHVDLFEFERPAA
jgi:hypothetical protein